MNLTLMIDLLMIPIILVLLYLNFKRNYKRDKLWFITVTFIELTILFKSIEYLMDDFFNYKMELVDLLYFIYMCFSVFLLIIHVIRFSIKRIGYRRIK